MTTSPEDTAAFRHKLLNAAAQHTDFGVALNEASVGAFVQASYELVAILLNLLAIERNDSVSTVLSDLQTDLTLFDLDFPDRS